MKLGAPRVGVVLGSGLGAVADAVQDAEVVSYEELPGFPRPTVAGHGFGTPAEIRAYRALGADAVGMSTVQETILARHCGLRVAAVSVITNLAEGMSEEPISHEQTLRAAQDGAGDLTRLLLEFI